MSRAGKSKASRLGSLRCWRKACAAATSAASHPTVFRYLVPPPCAGHALACHEPRHRATFTCMVLVDIFEAGTCKEGTIFFIRWCSKLAFRRTCCRRTRCRRTSCRRTRCRRTRCRRTRCRRTSSLKSLRTCPPEVKNVNLFEKNHV